MTEQRREFWWVAQTLTDGSERTLWDGSEREPEVAQVWFKDDGGVDFSMLAGVEDMFTPDEVRLIERVLPAGRAAAVDAPLRTFEDAYRIAVETSDPQR